MAKIKKNSPLWTNAHTKVVQIIKQNTKFILCLSLPDPTTLKIVESDASKLGFRGILR